MSDKSGNYDVSKKCAECAVEITKSSFALYNKVLCSVKCCKELRKKEEAKNPQIEGKSYNNPSCYGGGECH